MLSSLFSTMVSMLQITDHFTLYSRVPSEANQGWTLEFAELSEPIPTHYHKRHRHLVVGIEGELKIAYADGTSIVVGSGESVCIDAGVVHTLIPQGTARFSFIDLPAFFSDDDRFYDAPIDVPPWTPPQTEVLPPLDPNYFEVKIDAGDYAAYPLAGGSAVEDKWSVALLEIQSSPRHFHRIEREIFLVVGGELDLEIEGVHRTLATGDSVVIVPGQIHQLKSAKSDPVRVLCFNFPAFNPADMHLGEE